MTQFAHGIRFDTPIHAALYSLALAKQYERSAEFWKQFARDRGERSCETAQEAQRQSVRLEDKGERVLLRARGLYHYNLYGIDPHIEKLADALEGAASFVNMRSIQLQPAHLTFFERGMRLIATAPDLNGGDK